MKKIRLRRFAPLQASLYPLPVPRPGYDLILPKEGVRYSISNSRFSNAWSPCVSRIPNLSLFHFIPERKRANQFLVWPVSVGDSIPTLIITSGQAGLYPYLWKYVISFFIWCIHLSSDRMTLFYIPIQKINTYFILLSSSTWTKLLWRYMNIYKRCVMST